MKACLPVGTASSVQKWVMAAVLLLAAPAVSDEYDLFNTFCLENFGAEADSLTYVAFGSVLEIDDDSFWVRASVNSASICFATSLPAFSHIQYGLTTSYGSETVEAERFFYNHLHHLRNLSPGTTYHYRIVMRDESGATSFSEDYSLTTATMDGKVSVPGNLSGPPYILDQDGALYVLTENIDAPRRAFTITGDDVTLDLNGYTVTYDNDTPTVPPGAAFNEYLNSGESTFGVFAHYSVSGTITNGRIHQGSQASTGSVHAIGFNPIYLEPHPGRTFEICGLAIEYSGRDVAGIFHRGAGPSYLHHNTLLDRGTGITNRHQGVKAITCANGGEIVEYNLIKRARQWGVYQANRVGSNEIYIDSWAFNAVGITPGRNAVVYGNKVFGTGYQTDGIGWYLGDTDSLVYRHNFVFMQGDAPTNRDDESGAYASVNGLRLTQYGGSTISYSNYLYEGNIVIVKGRNGTTMMRGVHFFSDPYVDNLIFRNNVVKTEVLDDVTDSQAPAVACEGLSDRAPEQLPIYYVGNDFISNSVNVMFGTSYGSGGNHRFHDCRFVKLGNRGDYVTIDAGHWVYNSYGNEFYDCESMGGADIESSYVFDGDAVANLDYSVGRNLHVVMVQGDGSPIGNTGVYVTDEVGASYEGTTASDGLAVIKIRRKYIAAPPGQSNPTEVYCDHHVVSVDGFGDVVLPQEMYDVQNDDEFPVTLVFGGDGWDPPSAPGNLQFND